MIECSVNQKYNNSLTLWSCRWQWNHPKQCKKGKKSNTMNTIETKDKWREKYRMRGLNSRPLACEASVITTTPTRPALCFHFHLMTPAPSISHPTQMTTANTWYPCSCPDCPHRYYYCPQTRRVKWHLESGDSVNYFSSFRSSHVRSAIFYISYELPSGVFLHAALCQRQLSVSIQ